MLEYKCRWCAQWRGVRSFTNEKGKRCVKCHVCRKKPRRAMTEDERVATAEASKLTEGGGYVR